MQVYANVASAELRSRVLKALQARGHTVVEARSPGELREFLLLHEKENSFQVVIVIEMSSELLESGLIETIMYSPLLAKGTFLILSSPELSEKAYESLERLRGDIAVLPIDDRQLQIRLRSIEAQAHGARDRIELDKELGQLARGEKLLLGVLDPETGIPGHTAYVQFLQREWRRCLRYSKKISLIRLEVQWPAGTRSDPRTIAERLEGCVHRPGDLICALDENQFAAILSETDAAGARHVANRMFRAGQEINVSVRFGLGTVDPIELYRGMRKGAAENGIQVLEKATETSLNTARAEQPSTGPI